MTLIASVNLLMSSRHRRWMTMKETLTVQGFPMTDQHTHRQACSSFALRAQQALRRIPTQSGYHGPSRRSGCKQAGNSMHVTISGMVLLFAITQVQFDSGMMRLQLLARSSRHVMECLAASPRQSRKRNISQAILRPDDSDESPLKKRA
ncbi:unnamed protein product [Effrenium voratum]|nr:unnamed protein product [Effrenium voratum]